jgi:hypothetical protein
MPWFECVCASDVPCHFRNVFEVESFEEAAKTAAFNHAMHQCVGDERITEIEPQKKSFYSDPDDEFQD